MTSDPTPVLELRQYTLRPGTRDGFVARFEREFVETQQAAGIEVVGTFLDLDDPDRFVWIRAFASYDARGEALREFYEGPVWARLRDETNADLIDSDDVVMLTPGTPAPPVVAGRHPASGEGVPGRELHVHVWPVASDGAESELLASLATTGAIGVASSHPGPNNFPRQPIRADRVVVAITDTAQKLPGDELQRLRLGPTARSALR